MGLGSPMQTTCPVARGLLGEHTWVSDPFGSLKPISALSSASLSQAFHTTWCPAVGRMHCPSLVYRMIIASGMGQT